MNVAIESASAGPSRGITRTVAEGLRVLVVAGVPTGVLIVGIGSRLAMMLLRVTSSDRVRGIQSDDGFTIGRSTLSGTYNLMMIGAFVGVLGAGVYQWVSPWLIGPGWFRRVTVGLSCGAVVGSMLVHADGIDFTVLTPTWLAIGMFVALPAAFGVAISVAVDRVKSGAPIGRRVWLIPIILIVPFPMTLIVLLPAAVVLVAWTCIRPVDGMMSGFRSPRWSLAMRIGWLLIALLGLRSLVNDITAITA